VGKSTVAVNLALALGLKGSKVGLLDVDFHGPSVPILLGLHGPPEPTEDGRMKPAGFQTLKVMSIGFLLPDQDSAVIWRGPMKMGAIRQFLRDVDWGELDVLVVDSPPGTGDEPLSVAQIIPNVDGAVIVTTPQDLSLSDVRKSITFCRRLDLPVLGVLENMSGFACPKCGEVSEIFGAGGGKKMAEDMNVPFLGTIPIDPAMVKAGDEGKPFVYFYKDAPAARALEAVADTILDKLDERKNKT
jgi:Mrp family chromosome partitioning ATPase